MQFVGDFDGMYGNIDDPWGCKAGVLSLHNNILLDVVSEASDKEGCSIHDLGCGLGHLANRINNHLHHTP